MMRWRVMLERGGGLVELGGEPLLLGVGAGELALQLGLLGARGVAGSAALRRRGDRAERDDDRSGREGLRGRRASDPHHLAQARPAR